MGGEAILPYHYFRLLVRRGMDVRLIAHARNEGELKVLFPHLGDRIFYVGDTWLKKTAWSIGTRLPGRVAEITFFALVFLLDNFQMARLARSLVSRFSIDVVHQPIPVSPKEPSFVRGAGAPVVMGPMNGGMEYPPGFRRTLGALERLAHRLAKASGDVLNLLIPGKRHAAILLYANERTRLAFPAVLGRVEKRLLPENGVDLDLWREGWSSKDADAPPNFLFVGRLVDWKGVDYLLKAFARVAPVADARLTIVGDGAERSKLEALSRSLGLHERVAFKGFVDQERIAGLLRTARALVLPSIYECGGAVVLEAMAARTAVIATAWGGPLDYLDDASGILVPPDDEEQFVAALASAMDRLALDPELARRMGEHGLARVQAMFNWERKIDRMLEIYRDTLSPRAG
jgi:glycosyltransferase involved in cell wall biosynthesis